MGKFDPILKILPSAQEGDINKVIVTMTDLKNEVLSKARDGVLANIKSALEDPNSGIAFVEKEDDAQKKEIAKLVEYFKTYLEDIHERLVRLQKTASTIKVGPPPAIGVGIPGPPPPPPPPKR